MAELENGAAQASALFSTVPVAQLNIAPAPAPERVPSVGRSCHHNYKCFPVEQCVTEEGLFADIQTGLVPSASLTRKVLSEFIGTFILIFSAAGTTIMNERSGGSLTILGLAGGSGLAVMIIIFSTGHISGAHLNPAVTLAFASLRHFPWFEVPAFIASQVVASICASYALKVIYHPDLHGGVTVPAEAYWQSFVLELILSFILMFVVTAVATDTRAVGELAGIAVGATVFLNNLTCGEISGASMNPVRTLGPAIAANNYKGLWIYMVAPIIGTHLGAGAYTLIRLKDLEPARPVRSFRR